MHLVYIGGAADTAPAASLRALAGGGAVFVPKGLTAELRAFIEHAVPGGLAGQFGADELERVLAGRFPPDAVTVCVAGDGGPGLARHLRAEAAARGLAVVTTPDEDLFEQCLIAQDLVSLRRIIAVLREQCPWDREQTAIDIVSYTVEEVYELADAIAADDAREEHGELGDLLMQVYFLAQLLAEKRAGDVGTVAQDIERKLIRRHAHIFGDAVAETPGEVRGQWERIKREQEGREGIFHDVPGTLPALLFARKLQERAAAVGFDWDTAHEAFPKIAEEHGELAEVLLGHPGEGSAGAGPAVAGAVGGEAREEVDGGSGRATVGSPARRSPAGGAGAGDRPPKAPSPSEAAPPRRNDPRLRHEFGDLLFAVVNVARKAGVDPELALRRAAARFEKRVCAAAALAEEEGKDWRGLGLADQEEYYQRAKTRVGDGAGSAGGR